MLTTPVDAATVIDRAASFPQRVITGDARLRALRMAIKMIDLTTLEGRDTPEFIRSLCRKAISPGPARAVGRAGPPVAVPPVAAICVYPALVRVARESLRGSPVGVASVATGFPSGQYPLAIRLADVGQALAAGADEIDMVISRGLFLAGRDDLITDEIRQTRRMCAHATLKIIIETGELETYDAVRRACDLAMEAAASVTGTLEDGALFLKTSTGKVSTGARLPSSLVMLEAIRDHFLRTGVRVGMKAAGGLRTAGETLSYLVMAKEVLGDAWLTPRLLRFGASSLLNALVSALIEAETGRLPARFDLAEV